MKEYLLEVVEQVKESLLKAVRHKYFKVAVYALAVVGLLALLRLVL